MNIELISALKDKQLKGILGSAEYKGILHDMVQEIHFSAMTAPNEATIESRLDTELSILFNGLFSHLGYTYLPIKEDAVETRRCITKGRADTSVGALIIEYKHHSVLKNVTKRKSALEQAISYIEAFNAACIRKTVGFVTDGVIGSFISLSDNVIHKEEFSDLTVEMLDRLIQNIIGLGQKALTAENLVKDFCVVETNGESYSVRLSKALFNILESKRSQKTEMLIEEWEDLFKLAHDDSSQQQAIINRKKALSGYFGIDLEEPQQQYLALFALQTTYMIIVKTVAFKSVSQVRYGRDLVDFEKVVEYNSNSLKSVFQDLEEGSIFRQYGIMNLLEGDFFSWYVADAQWSEEIANLLAEMIKILVKYGGVSVLVDKYKAHDFFKDLYVTLIPDSVRHALGEYYTKHWLAQHVFSESIKYIRNKNWRGLDPCCGSGTFITIMINEIIQQFDGKPNHIILGQILNRVFGIDLNPVTVLTARVNYFLNIAPFLDDEENVEIPIYLGDAAYIPSKIIIGGVECFSYTINTKVKPIVIILPVSATKNLGLFSRTMTNIELDIKNADEQTVASKLINLIDKMDRVPDVVSIIYNLASQLVDLERKGWNGIWSRIITNYLSTASIGRFDIIVGNPPWVDWKNLPSNYREKIKTLCISRKLFSGDSVTGGINLNICALISNVVAENWLSEAGILAFLMPESILFQQSYEGYRNFYLSDNKRLYFQRVSDWTYAGHPFKPVQQNFFTYFIAQTYQDYRTGIPVDRYTIKKGKKSYENEEIVFSEYFDNASGFVAQCDPERSMFTKVNTRQEAIEFNKITGNSYYTGREGVEVYPQELLIFTTDSLMRETEKMITVVNIQNKKSKFKIAQKRQYLEKEYLFPLVKGVDIKRFCLSKSDYIVPFPYDPEINTQAALSLEDLSRKAPKLAAFYQHNKAILCSQNVYSNKLISDKHAEFYSLARVGKYTFGNYFVAYRDNSKWGACVVSTISTPWGEKKPPIFQNHAPYISQDAEGNYITEDEAHYICAILNTPIASAYIARSSDSRSYPIRPRIKLPKFDPTIEIHIALCELSKEAHLSCMNDDRMSDIDAKLNELYLELCE